MFKIEITDTFGGEANYSWVRRGILALPDRPTHAQVVRAAKKFAGWTGKRCRVDHYGGEVSIRLSGAAMVAFAYWCEPEPDGETRGVLEHAAWYDTSAELA